MSSESMTTTTTDAWKDGKKLAWLFSPALPMFALALVVLAHATGFGLLYLAGPILLYGVIPFLDWMVGTDKSNPPESAVPDLEDDRYYRAIVYAYIPTQFVLTIFGAWIVVSSNLAVWELLSLVITVGLINGVGINTAHELGHKKGSGERWLAKLTLAPVAYGHFYVEHNKGHHKNVATPEDPASSKMGETFWAFLPRTMIGSLRSAWRIEKERLARLGRGPWTLQNENIQAWLMTVVLFGALTLLFGWAALGFLLLQAFYGASLLEVINYIEHYGLLRQKEPSGRYERCTPAHSWNSNQIITNVVLYQLQRHSDHHANPTRRYQALRHFKESPQLPFGYAGMLLIAYVPWLWFRQMDPLVVRHYDGDLTRANLYPPRREALLKKWHASSREEATPVNFPGESRVPTAQVENATRFQCTDCGYVYDEKTGCEHEGFPAGTAWSAIPDDWPCPDCAVREKIDFRPVSGH